MVHCQDQSDEEGCESYCPGYLTHIPKDCPCTHMSMNAACMPLHILYAAINAVHLLSTKHDIFSEIMNGKIFSNGCAQGWSLCSVNNQSECFPNEKLCIFERDKYGSPLYCTNTEHLNLCDMDMLQRLCPTMYRCKTSYCIPLSMVGTSFGLSSIRK